MLFVEKSPHCFRVLGTRLGEIEGERIDRVGMKRDQECGITPESAGAAYAFAPKRRVRYRRDMTKLLREPGPGVEHGRSFPAQPAYVVLLGCEANLIVRRRRGEALIAPGASQLAGKPSMARLRNGYHIEAVLAKQHESRS